jgi:hypothetical protein
MEAMMVDAIGRRTRHTDISRMSDLVGHTIVAAWLVKGPKEDDCIGLHMGPGDMLLAVPVGDCCSHCFIQHVESASALVGTVTEVEELATHPATEEERAATKASDNVLDVWAYRVHTEKGICTIEMRLDHNGYYGGGLEILHREATDKERFTPLEDF